MKNVTVIKKRNGENVSYTTIPEEELIANVRNGEYSSQVMNIRDLYPRIRTGVKAVLEKELEMEMRSIPQVAMQQTMVTKRGNAVPGNATGLVLLQANNLPTTDAVEKLRETVVRIPFTRMAFVGATGYDLKIVCAFAMEQGLSNEEQLKLLISAHANLHYIYSSQLGLHLDNRQPTLEETIAVSRDPLAYFNPQAVEYVVVNNGAPNTLQLPNLHIEDSLLNEPDAEAWANIYEHCHTEALSQAHTMVGGEAENYNDVVLSLLAQNCAKSGVPQELAVTRTLWKLRYRRHEDTTRRVFQNEYADFDKEPRPLGMFSKSELSARRTRSFIERTYALRRNVLSDEVEYCRLNGYDFQYHPLDDTMLNSMSQEARFAGVGSSRQKQDIIEYVQSDMVYRYDPIADWLDALPRWDGQDHVAKLLKRLPTETPHYERFMHTWLLSMVAHWMGKDCQYGNAIVPLLIGDQGCGKSSFCAKLLPEELRRYFNDNVSFRSEHDLNLNLSSFLLINIDEFDKLKASEQPVLKYLLSKSDVKGRVPYGINIEVRRRYASFIATTNSRKPLTDPTGSRRFVCIEICSGMSIDHESPIDYQQLYAQLVSEINGGARYWFDNTENQTVMQQNAPYQRPVKDKNATSSTLVELVAKTFRQPQSDEKAPRLTLREIALLMSKRWDGVGTSITELRQLSAAMKVNGFICIRGASGYCYRVVEK